MELARGKRVYTAYVHWSATALRTGLNIDAYPAAFWSPPGDIKIIGARVSADINVGANADLSKTVSYLYAEVSLVPAMSQAHSIVIAFAHIEVVELPTIGEHACIGERSSFRQVMFPAGEGLSTNEWHPIYLNATYRNRFTAVDLEMGASYTLYYVEL